VKVSTHPELRDVKFAGTKDLTRADDGVVLGLVELVDVVDVDAEFAGEDLVAEG